MWLGKNHIFLNHLLGTEINPSATTCIFISYNKTEAEWCTSCMLTSLLTKKNMVVSLVGRIPLRVLSENYFVTGSHKTVFKYHQLNAVKDHPPLQQLGQIYYYMCSSFSTFNISIPSGIYTSTSLYYVFITSCWHKPQSIFTA